MYIACFTKEYLTKVLNDFNVLLLANLPKSCKITLLKNAGGAAGKYLDLADMALRTVANDELVLFLQQYTPPVIIDNVQYAPELLPVIKEYAQKKAKQGDFILISDEELAIKIDNMFKGLGKRYKSVKFDE